MSVTKRNYLPRYIHRQVEEQGHLCAYCLLPFGTVTRHKGIDITQKPQGDHFVPWVYGQVTRVSNLVAACQICNWVKGSRLFEDVNAAQRWILTTRAERAYQVQFVPSRPITLDSWGWASEYARYLIG